MFDNYIISNPVWANPENTIINCTLTDKITWQQFEFSASLSDPEPYGRQIYEYCVNGAYGHIAPYVKPYVEPYVEPYVDL
jgi:hypothetical protein